MPEYVDLSHKFSDGMPGFRMEHDDGYTEYTASIRSFLTHEETRPMFDGRCSFEITEMEFQTSVGTYLDAPAHRFPDGRDIADLGLSELVTEGVVVDARGHDPYEAVGESVLPDTDLSGKAVLFNFGWDDYWETEEYRSYPYVSEGIVDRVIAQSAALVGVDTINVDDDRNPDRPAHTRLLEEGILVVENLRGLDRLREPFRFFAIPIPAVDAVSMPVRAFAQLR